MNKAIRSLMCLCLSLVMLCASIAPAEAQGRTLYISSAEDFIRFSENCILDSYSVYLAVYLQSDIDLSGYAFSGVPYFAGWFEGGGHRICGLSLESEGSVQGLFRYVASSGVVNDLHVSGTVSPGGSHSTVGGIAGSNAGRIIGCSFEGQVSGSDYVGGIAGENELSGLIESCSVSGSISGSHFVGGMAGENLGVIRSCTNRADINTSAGENQVALSDMSMAGLIGTENANTVTDVGGIAGISRGYVRNSLNLGDVGYRQMGYNIGGIVGSSQGYVAQCENYGNVSGRKEVGGIVGQMEPSTYIRFEKDTMQILREQLDGLAGIAGTASANMQYTANELGGQMNILGMQIDETAYALGGMMGDFDFTDPDSYVAAGTVLGAGLSNMGPTIGNMSVSIQNSMSALQGSINAMQGQISAIYSTLDRSSENMGAAIIDRSDEDDPLQLGSKTEGCNNYGSLTGDMNVGGIVGAIAIENDFDTAEDVLIGENSSLNFTSELRSVVLDCSNRGTAEAVHSNLGGIAGWMQLGLVKECRSTGTLLSPNADHVGGIAGKSESYIRSCSSKCQVSGTEYVGGIAGEARVVSGCRSMSEVLGTERAGALIGWAELHDEDGMPTVQGNYYLSPGDDIGGIDGISYEAVAQTLGKEAFFSLAGVPEFFSHVTLSFVHEDGSMEEQRIPTGGRLDESLIPLPREKAGFIASWDDFDNSGYDFDRIFHTVYTANSTTIRSAQQISDGLPLVLAEGSFPPGSTLRLLPLHTQPSLEPHDQLLVLCGFEADKGGQAHTLRYHVSESGSDRIKAYVLAYNGHWYESEHRLLGSYVEIPIPEGVQGIALVWEGIPQWQYKAVIGIAVFSMSLALVLIVCNLVRKRRRAKSMVK